MVPEIKNAKYRAFCHFGAYFPFDPPNNAKNQNFEKIKKTFYTHVCIANDDHMRNGS